MTTDTKLQTNLSEVPKGYMKDAVGRLVLKEKVKEVDLLRDKLVKKWHKKSLLLNKQIRDFKAGVMSDVHEFLEISADKYGAKMGGNKGNVTLFSYDGSKKITRTFQEKIYFDERLQAAKALIDECIHRWSKGSNANIKVLVEHAFQADKEGNISHGRVLGLRRLKIDDMQWHKAMDAISDSIQVTGTKSYIRFHQRLNDDEKHQSIALDIAGA